MLRCYLVVVLLATFAAACFANDTQVQGYGGSVVRLPGENSQITMQSEVVQIDLYKDYYTTSCDFVFVNEGKGVKVTMGFPERSSAAHEPSDATDPPPPSTIKNFFTSVDGHTVVAKRMMAKLDRGDFTAYWTKSVTFAAHQTRRVHVEFRSPYGVSVSGKVAAYDFTGGNWHGKVRTSDLIVTEKPGAPNLPFAYLNNHRVQMLPRPGGAKYDWHDWKAEGELIISEHKR